MKNWHCLLVVLVACGTDETKLDDMMDTPIDPPLQASALERCLLDGGTLRELWSVSNQHGPVASIVAGSLVVLGGEDGSVKQWSIDGDEPLYGKPFTTAGAPVAALALASDGHILAATRQGEIAGWRLADAEATTTTTFDNVELSALAVAGDAARVVTGTPYGDLYVVDRASGVKTELASTLWGVDTISFAAGDRLYTAGHWYGTPQIERRTGTAPVDVVDEWNDRERTGDVRALAVDAQGTVLVAAGDGFVATFAPDDLAAGPRAITSAVFHTAVGTVLLPGRSLFVTAGTEGTLRVWNTETLAPLVELPIAEAIGIAAATDGTRLFTSGPDGRLHAYGCE